MGRPPSFSVNQWLRRDSHDQLWTDRARCTKFLGLPWISDCTPNRAEMNAMTDVCSGCPVILQCAAYALHTSSAGGFYAGVWIPWRLPESGRANRQHARRALRAFIVASNKARPVDV